jgi:hypothetical protein
MRGRHTEQLAAERMRLLEIEARLQRAELAATFDKWEKRKTLAWGRTLATWGFRMFARPRIRWLIATTLLSRMRGRIAR